MSVVIRIDEEVLDELFKKSKEMDKKFPAVNDVLRYILGLGEKEAAARASRKRRGRPPTARDE